MRLNTQSIAPTFPSDATPEIVEQEQRTLGLGPGRVHRGGKSAISAGASRASNEARAWLYTAVDEFSPAYRVGVFLANHARYATKADRQWKVKPGDIFAYWPQKKIAAELGCSVRTIKRGVRSLRQAGVITVRQRVRPYGASCVFVRPGPSGVPSGVPSHREPRTEPRKEKNVLRTVSKLTDSPLKLAEKGQTKQQRLVAAVCGKLGFAVNFAGLEEFDESENSEKQKLIKRLLRVEARHDRRAERAIAKANPARVLSETGRGHKGVSQEHTFIEPSVIRHMRAVHSKPDPPPRPVPAPMTPELRRELEADARAKGYIPVGGKWVKTWL